MVEERLTLREWGVITAGSCGPGNRGCGGDAGSITITAEEIELLNHGIISSDTRGAGAGGDITILAGSLLVSGVAENPLRQGLFS